MVEKGEFEVESSKVPGEKDGHDVDSSTGSGCTDKMKKKMCPMPSCRRIEAHRE